jgi:hypothetical protein
MASREQMRSAALASGAACLVCGAGLGILGWIDLFPALVLGVVVGTAAFLASHRHRDPALQGMALGMALLGIVIAVTVNAVRMGGDAGDSLRLLVAVSYWEVVGPALAAMVGAIIRFLL